jgi:hypothetical protein
VLEIWIFCSILITFCRSIWSIGRGGDFFPILQASERPGDRRVLSYFPGRGLGKLTLFRCMKALLEPPVDSTVPNRPAVQCSKGTLILSGLPPGRHLIILRWSQFTIPNCKTIMMSYSCLVVVVILQQTTLVEVVSTYPSWPSDSFSSCISQIMMGVCLLCCRWQQISDTGIDTGIVTAATKIVQAFKNSEIILPPSDFVKENFEENVITVQALMANDTAKSQQTIRSQLLLGLAETCVGLYSTFHDISTYENGYGHEESRRLGWM